MQPNNKTLNVVIAISRERLTQKQKLILYYLSKNNPNLSATKVVELLASMYKYSKSALWNNVRGLKSSLLIETNSGVLSLTKIGGMLAKAMFKDA